MKSPSSKPESQKQIKVKGKPDLNSTVIEKKTMSKQEIDKDKTLVLDHDDDIDSGTPQTTFASSHATTTTKVNKTPINRKKKIQLQNKVVKKNKHTLSTDTSDKQSDTSQTRDQQTKPSDLFTLEDTFDKED